MNSTTNGNKVLKPFSFTDGGIYRYHIDQNLPDFLIAEAFFIHRILVSLYSSLHRVTQRVETSMAAFLKESSPVM